MYGGALLVMLGWALLSSPLALIPLGVAAAFLDAKRRREEAWLVAKHPDYADYRRQVRRQFIPFVWYAAHRPIPTPNPTCPASIVHTRLRASPLRRPQHP